jgi:hypothetical protein
MPSLTIISALLGVWLGLTFRVFILVPAAILALATLAGSGAANEAGALWMIALDVSAVAAMQAGYIGGSALLWRTSIRLHCYQRHQRPVKAET